MSVSEIGKRLAPALALGWGVFHCASVAVGLMPDNPLRRAAHSTMVAYAGTFWDQNWHLFSPNPPTSGDTTLVRCRMSDGSETPYLDTAAGVTKKNFEWPLGPYPKLKYLYKGVYSDLIGMLSKATELACHGEQTSECQERGVKVAMRSPQHAAALELSKDICVAYSARKDLQVASVQLRFMRLDVFPYSKRDEIGSRRWYKKTAYDLPTTELGPAASMSSLALSAGAR